MIDRFVTIGVLLCGLLLLVASLFFSWHSIPAGPQVILTEAPATLLFRGIIVVSILLICGELVRSYVRKKFELRLLSLEVLAVIVLLSFYPYVVINWCPDYSGDAAWLQQQHDSLTWLGGDVYRAHSDRYDYAALSINAQDIPFHLAPYRPPSGSVLSIGVSDLKELIHWMGYGPAFLQFLGKGWVLALLGSSCVFLSILGMNHRQISGVRRADLLKSHILVLGLGSVGFLFLSLVPIHSAGSSLEDAKRKALQGENRAASEALGKLTKALPALRFDTGLILQKGYFESELGSGEGAEAQLYQAVRLGKSGLKQQALEKLLKVLKSKSCAYEVRREAVRLTLHAAVDALNSGKSDRALNLLDRIISADPACVIAHFHRQLLAVKLGEIKINRESHQKILSIYQGFNRKEKKGVIAASWLMLAQGEYQAGDLEAASLARRKSKGF